MYPLRVREQSGGGTLLAVAHGTVLAGMLANRIFFLGAALTEYKLEIGVMVIFVLCLVMLVRFTTS